MRLKLDENLPSALEGMLGAHGHDVETVVGESLSGSPDASVWAAAQAEGRLLVTQDLDFSDIRAFAPGTHAGLVLVRLQQPSRRALEQYIERLFGSPNAESWRGCFVVATDAKVRVRRPPPKG